VALVLLVILLPMLVVGLIACRCSALGCHSGRWTLLPVAARFPRNLAFVPAACRGASYFCPCARSATQGAPLSLESDGLHLLFVLHNPMIGLFSRVGHTCHLATLQEEMAKPHRHRKSGLRSPLHLREGTLH